MNKYDINRNTQIAPFISGGIAGLLSWSVVYPLDHIKTYYQLNKYLYGKYHYIKQLNIISILKEVVN